jgi:hypothetical protein
MAKSEFRQDHTRVAEARSKGAYRGKVALHRVYTMNVSNPMKTNKMQNG